MNQIYKRTFDNIVMPEKRAKTLQVALLSRCSEKETEVNPMNTNKIIRRPAAILVAILIIASLAVTAFACGGYVVYQVRTGEIKLSEDSILCNWIDFEPEEILPYENYIESNGEVTVTFDVEDPEQGK